MPLELRALPRTVARPVIAGAALVVLAGCATLTGTRGAPATFVRTTSDVRSTRLIDVRDGQTKAALFRATGEVLSMRSSVDVRDASAGFLMTTWQASATRAGIPDLRYRTRVVVRFLGDDWRRVSVRAEANWQRGEEWDVGYDRQLLDQVSAELAARIGRPSVSPAR